jgi:hypothetical protein
MTSASTCVRFCPIYFECCNPSPLCRESGEERRDSALPANEDDVFMGLGYKLIFAVGTTDSVYIYSTGKIFDSLRVLGLKMF